MKLMKNENNKKLVFHFFVLIDKHVPLGLYDVMSYLRRDFVITHDDAACAYYADLSRTTDRYATGRSLTALLPAVLLAALGPSVASSPSWPNADISTMQRSSLDVVTMQWCLGHSVN
jgi:hypothetical protein